MHFAVQNSKSPIKFEKKGFSRTKSAKHKQPASLRKSRNSTKSKAKFAGKPQGWQCWSTPQRGRLSGNFHVAIVSNTYWWKGAYYDVCSSRAIYVFD